MNAPLSIDISRRALLAGGGAVVVSFSLLGMAKSAQTRAAAGRGVPDNDMLDSWIRVDAQGVVTVYTGRTEFGQGVKTAMIQLAAEELNLDPQSVKIVSCDTALTPNEGYTSGSRAMADGGVSVRAAAGAYARDIAQCGCAETRRGCRAAEAGEGQDRRAGRQERRLMVNWSPTT